MREALIRKGWSSRAIKILLKWLEKSTTSQYQGIWKKFIMFLASHNISHDNISTAVVCDFLSFQAQILHRKYRTLGVYKSALRHPLLFACDLDINDPYSDAFMRGAFKFNPPIRAKEMPSWSMNTLLKFLKTPVFEPLEEVSYERCSQKTLVLNLFGSGRRISEVTNISRKSRKIPSSNAISLPWVDGFTPKVHNAKFQTPCPSLKPLTINRSGQDNLLCPVRAYKIYLERSRSKLERVPLNNRTKSLWVHNKITREANKTYLTKLFIDVVKDCRIYNDLDPNIPIGPHQVRKLSASYGIQVGQDIEVLRKTMGFSSTKILLKNYVAWVPPLDVHCVLPGGTFDPTEVNN